MPKAITSLTGYIIKITTLSNQNPGTQLLYRGHSSSDYSISPSIYRNSNLSSAEHLMMRQLLAQHPKDFSGDIGLFDQLVRAQHYGLPTRLLDVSLNPLVALYFAASSRQKSRGQVIVFKPAIGKQKYFDSDVVSCLSALAMLSGDEKHKLRDQIIDALLKAEENGMGKLSNAITGRILKEFNSTYEIRKLIQFVRHEKPNFRRIIQPIDLVKPVSVTPRKHHNRIIAQNGAFIIFGVGKRRTEENMDHISYEVIDIAEDSKKKFISDLASVGISETSLFPDIEKSALAIKTRYN